MLEKTIEILSKHVKEGIEIKPESALVADLGLTSLDIVDIIVSFEDEFDIEISGRDIVPENFANVATIEALVEKYL